MRWIWGVLACLYAQGGVPIGQWGVYAYHGNIREVTYVAPYFWCLSSEGVVLIDGESGAYRELSRATGLYANQPTALYGDPYSQWVFLGYDDGTIQYGTDAERLQLFQDIARNPIYTSRAIRSFHAKGDTLAIGTDFGVVLWQKSSGRVLGTVPQFPGAGFGEGVIAVRWGGGTLWCLTAKGLFALPEGRAWTGPWEKRSGAGFLLPDTLVNRFQGWGETPEGFLIAYAETLYRWNGSSWVAHPLPPALQGRRVLRFFGERGGWALAVSDTNVFFFSAQGAIYQEWNPGPTTLWCDPSATYHAWGSSWIGAWVRSPKIQVSTDSYQRLRGGSVTDVLPTPEGLFFLHDGWTLWRSGWGNFVTFYRAGASRGEAFSLSFPNGRSYSTPAGPVWDGATAWIGTGLGIVRLSPAGIVDTFSAYNAPFDGLFPDAQGKPTTLRFTALVRDNTGAIWAGKYFGNSNLAVWIPSSNTWRTLPYSDGLVVSIQIDSRGYKWILYRNGALRVIDDRGNPDNPTGFRTRLWGGNGTTLPGLPSPNIYVVAPDRSGAIWLGTDKGVAVLYGDPFDGTLSVSLPVIENRYLLEEETITDIAIDGQNRKWIGTVNSGAYVLSPDGNRQVANFNTTNSPLPSNFIFHIRPWGLTGEIFLITSAGTVSYRDWATDPSPALDSLYIFPNPVSRHFEGWIGIRGLSEGSTVRIFTVDGQAVRLLQSFGGQAVWDLRTLSGEKVSPGVYLVGAIDAEGQRSAVGKIVVTD
ncbi:MAG: hypothetical protein N3A68_00905 [Bacteroidia bacterium]|nr:hypothetical protein [Bacteroidia bacterium]GIV23567.1 MAG: hypothetical protein KatS3mg025_1226 [Bacteroidia bacterium]